MMLQKSDGVVRLKDLTASSEVHGLRSLYIANAAAPVRELALVSDFEELVSVGPDTVVLLSPGVARGGWMISAALRYAWERKACALIVPEQAFTDTVIELARRLDVSLFSSETEISRLAIDIAIQIGVARAGSLARLQAFTTSLSHASTLSDALLLTSEELGGARVSIESSDVTILQSKTVPPRDSAAFTTTTLERITVSIMPAVSPFAVGPQTKRTASKPALGTNDVLVAEVAPGTRPLAEEVLFAAAPVLRALFAETRMQATLDSLPLLTASALLGTSKGNSIAEPAFEEISHLSAASFPLPINGRFAAVFFISPPSEYMGSLIHQAWQAVAPSAPLAKLADGWLGVAPLKTEDPGSNPPFAAQLRESVQSHRATGVRIGISRVHESPENTYHALREAWFAARIAEPLTGAGQALVEFDDITAGLVLSVLPPEFAAQLAEELFPDLLADPSGAELVRSVVAFLEHHGSITNAAEALQIHRNTLQTRLRRVEELGVHLSDPSEVLSIHLLLNSLLSSRHWK